MDELVTLVYIGRRDRRLDVTYGTGEWFKATENTPATAKKVPADLAKKMLKHFDLWEEYQPPLAEASGFVTKEERDAVIPNDTEKENPDIVEVVTKKTDDAEKDEEVSQHIRDNIMAMSDKDAIASFIVTNYGGFKLDKRASLENMKQEAIRIVDQFGVTP